MGIESVRARLRDRQVKEGARGTDEITVCLDVELVAELERLNADLAMEDRVDVEVGKRRLGSPPAESEDSETATALKARIAEVEQEIRQSQLRLVFRSISSTDYQRILNGNPEANEQGEAQAAFFDALAAECLWQAWETDESGESLVDVTWAEIRPALSYGEWESATLKVIALNRRKVDIPFSLRSTGKTRS